jgi:hypothetical protein
MDDAVPSSLSALFEIESLKNVILRDVSGFNPKDRSSKFLQNEVKFLLDDNEKHSRGQNSS